MKFSRMPVAEREITVTRVFAAPRALVFSMFTDAKHLAAWWGPHTWDNPVCEADPRPGGRILIHMRGPDGTAHPMGGVYHEIVPHERIAFTTFVDMPDGSRMLESHNTVRFEESRGKTKVILTAHAGGFTDFTRNMLAGMEAGWSQSLDKLAAHAARVNGNQDAEDQAAIRAIFGDRTNALFGKVADLAVDVGGDIAIARGLGHMTGTKKNGDKVDLWTRVTIGFVRRNGAWTVTHQHNSVPFLMDGSFRAAVDLKP
jgi:uncharacterized protein YndB with AHSA1/START domain/ketosteroid isomerase-like protein